MKTITTLPRLFDGKNFRRCQYCLVNHIYDDDQPMCIECMEDQILKQKHYDRFYQFNRKRGAYTKAAKRIKSDLYAWHDKFVFITIEGKKVPAGPPKPRYTR